MEARAIMKSTSETIRYDVSLGEAVGFMRSRSLRFLAVVNDDNELVGHLSQSHMRSALGTSRPVSAGASVPGPRITAVMGPGSLFIDEDDEVQEALTLMEEFGTAAIPVVDACGRVVGTLTYEDALHATRRTSSRC